MRSDVAAIIAFGLTVCCVANAAAPTYSCFDPPDEGQTNPLGEGLEDVVESECCEALIDERWVESLWLWVRSIAAVLSMVRNTVALYPRASGVCG